MPHQVFVCVTKNIITFGTILAEVKCWIFKNSYI
jgi:hypothetical protein